MYGWVCTWREKDRESLRVRSTDPSRLPFLLLPFSGVSVSLRYGAVPATE